MVRCRRLPLLRETSASEGECVGSDVFNQEQVGAHRRWPLTTGNSTLPPPSTLTFFSDPGR